MFKYETYQMEMVKLFNLFTVGDAVLRINNLCDLYEAYKLFRDSSIIFCNTNKMTDVDLIASVAQKRLRCLDLTRDRATSNEYAQLNPGYRLTTRALYYFLKEGNYGFKGFPVYLHVLPSWDDSKYSANPEMLQEMEIPLNYLKQIELLYASNQKLYRIDEMNPLNLIEAVDTNATALWEEICSEQSDGIPLVELAHRLNRKVRYPVTCLPQLGLRDLQEMVYTYNQALKKCSMNGIQLLLEVVDSFVEKDVFTGTITHVSLPGSIEKMYDLFSVMTGDSCFYFTNKEHFNVFASLFDFQAFDFVSLYHTPEDPKTGELIPFWFWFDRWRRMNTAVSKCPSELPEVKFDADHYAIAEAISKRMLYVLNAVQNLSLSLPGLGGILPPRFILSLRDIIFNFNEKDSETNVGSTETPE